LIAKFGKNDFGKFFYLTSLHRLVYIYDAIRYLSNSVQMSSVNLRGNVEKTLAIKEFKRDYSLMAKFFFILDPDVCKNEVLKRFGRYQ